jgi:lipoyl(octanoyl) transferase
VSRPAHLLNLGTVEYREALDLQNQIAAEVASGERPDTVLLLEHPPTITLGRRTEEGEVHVPDGADVAIVEVDRGGKSTYHAPGQLVCYPIFDLARHGQDVQRFCRDLEEALIQTMAAFDVEATRIDGLTGVWLESPPRKIASIGIHITKWVTTHGYALNVDLDTAPFTEWITACGLEDASFTTIAKELARPVIVEEVRPHAAAAFEEVFDLNFEELPADEGAGLWPQPLHARLTGKPTEATHAGTAQGVEQVATR